MYCISVYKPYVYLWIIYKKSKIFFTHQERIFAPLRPWLSSLRMCSLKYMFTGVLTSTFAQGEYFYPHWLVAYGTAGENGTEVLAIQKEKGYIFMPLAICKLLIYMDWRLNYIPSFINIWISSFLDVFFQTLCMCLHIHLYYLSIHSDLFQTYFPCLTQEPDLFPFLLWWYLCFHFTHITIVASYLSLFDKIVLKLFIMEFILQAWSSSNKYLWNTHSTYDITLSWLRQRKVL